VRYRFACTCTAVRPGCDLVEEATRMNLRRLVIWLLIFCALLIYVLMFERTEAPQPLAVLPAEKYERVFSLEVADIIGVIASNGEKTVQLARTDQDMRIIEPVGMRATDDLINSLLSAITEAVIVDELEPNDDQSLYGLNPPAFTIQVYTTHTDKPQTLLLGANAPSMINMYAHLPQQNRTVLLGTYLRFTLKTFLENIRPK
jgi:hypothetical protein